MVEVDKEYQFTGPDGKVTLADLFDGKRQLIVGHVMFDPDHDKACHGCSFFVDQMPTHLGMLRYRDTNFVLVSRAPYEKTAAFQKRMGWPQPWYSSYGSDFNYDYHVSQDESVAPVEYNYLDKEALVTKGFDVHTKGEQPGLSVFLRGPEGGIYHTYSSYARGQDHLLVTLGLLDLTPLGRQDEKDMVPGGPMYHDEFPA